jgi:cytochrome P450
VIADELLEALSGRDSFDVIAEYASPVPIIVIAEMLGVGTGDLAQFKRWSDARSQVFNIARTPEQAAEAAAARTLGDGICKPSWHGWCLARLYPPQCW